MKGVELLIVVVYLVGCIAIGLYTRKQAARASTGDYLTAGRSIGMLVNGVAIYAAFATGGTMLGNMGVSYFSGWGYIQTFNAGVALGFMITAFFVAKPLRNLRIATVPEFLRVRFHSKPLDAIVPLVLIGCITAYVTAQMKVVGMIGEQLLGIPYIWSVLIVGAVFLFYVIVGGMWAVTFTDFMQGLVMLVVAVGGGLIAISYGGGLAETYTKAQMLKPVWTQSTVPLISYIGAFLVWATVQPTLPHTVMRIFSAKDERTGRHSLTLGLFLYFLTTVFTLIFITAAAIIIARGGKLANADAAFLLVIDNLFPTWMKGLAYAGIFAAVMSSVSAMLLSIGAAVSYDLLRTFRPRTDERTTKLLTIVSVLVFGTLAILFALNPPPLLTILYSAAMGVFASSLFFPTILGIWWKRMNKWGAFAGVLGGAISYLILMLGTKLPALSHICFALPISLVLCVAVSLLTPPPSAEELERIALAHQREV